MTSDSSSSPTGGIPGENDPHQTLARLEKRLLARIRKMMGPEAREGAESSDVLQSVFADALTGLSSGELRSDRLLPWMTEVARNKIIDEVRRQRDRPRQVAWSDVTLAGQTSPPSRLTEVEAERALLETLAQLDPERRRVIALRCDEGLSWIEVARALGRSEEAVRKLYHRALLELGQHLALRRLGPDPRPVG